MCISDVSLGVVSLVGAGGIRVKRVGIMIYIQSNFKKILLQQNNNASHDFEVSRFLISALVRVQTYYIVTRKYSLVWKTILSTNQSSI